MDSTVASITELTTQEEEDQHKVLAFHIITILVGLIGVCGNGIVLTVIYKSRKTKKSRLQNAFLVNQTAMDLVSSVLLVVTFIYKMVPTIRMEGSAGLALCVCLEGEGLLWILLSASAFTLMSLTFERYIKIVFPIRQRTSFTDAKKATLLAMSWVVPFCWLLAFVLAATKVKDGKCFYQGFWPSAELARFYGWTYILIFYFIPLAFFVFSYGHMLWALKKSNVQVGDNQQSGGNVSRAQVNIIKIMVLVSACFAILWAPAHFYYFAYIIGVYNGHYLSLDYYIYNIVGFTNSVINPFIYVWKIAEFREMVLEMFGLKTSSTV